MKHVISANKNRKAYLVDDDGSELELDVMNIEAEQRPFSPVELTLKCSCDGDAPTRNAVPHNMRYVSAIFNPPATIVLWKDGTKTVVKCDEKDTFDPKYGLALCFMKKALGNKSRNLNDVLHEFLSDPDDIAEQSPLSGSSSGSANASEKETKCKPLEVRKMTEKEYNESEGVRRSDLWRMEDSAEKFRYFLDHPVEQTPAMAFGSACHKMILEPNDFGSEYAVAPQVDGRTKEGKEIKARFAEENAGKTIVSADDAVVMAEMEAALEACPLANELIRGEGQAEVPIFWTDPETGEKCKAKLDRVIREDGRCVIVDYKTAAHADTERFHQEIFKLGYHFQAGFYSEGLKNALNLDYRPRFLFVAQEKKAPYSVNVIEVTEDVMAVGVAKFHELLGKMHECKAVDIWPGYCDDIPNEAFIPGWMSFEEEE